MDLLNDKVVLLTGAGGGIGRAIAEKLAQCGMKIILFGGNNVEKLKQTQEIVEKYAACLAIPGDLTNPDFIRTGLQKAPANAGVIDVIAELFYNIAGDNPFVL